MKLTNTQISAIATLVRDTIIKAGRAQYSSYRSTKLTIRLNSEEQEIANRMQDQVDRLRAQLTEMGLSPIYYNVEDQMLKKKQDDLCPTCITSDYDNHLLKKIKNHIILLGINEEDVKDVDSLVNTLITKFS